MILCRTLGPVEISIGKTHAPAELLWRKNLALLIYLARSPKRARTREHLIGLLWADKPEAAARHSLREAVRVLRRHLGDQGVETEGGQVRLVRGAVQLDLEQFEQLVAAKDWSRAAALIAGEFMEGFSVPGASELEDWLGTERTLWRQRSVDALVRSSEALLEAGNPSAANDAAQRALGLDPTSNAAVSAAMKSRTLSGDRAGALERFEAFAARLKEEIGIEPDAETRALAERVKREREWHLPVEEAAPWAGAESRRAPLVGRERELGALLEAWHDCRDKTHGTVGVIEGDPGTGKTRLAEEFLARARLDGATTSAVRAVDADASEPLSGVMGLARGGLLHAPGLAASPPQALATFAARIPAWADRLATVGGETPLAPGRALSDIVQTVSEERSVVLQVDNAQWLDPDSFLALTTIVRDSSTAPVFVLFTTDAHPPRPELDELRSRIGRDVAGCVIHLCPFGAEALRALAKWALPRFNEMELERVARRISVDSAGLPLLAVELFHAVALGLDLAQTQSAWPEPFKTLDQTMPGDLPDAVTAAIRIGFRRLTPNAQSVLNGAAVLGDRIEAGLLARASGLEMDAVWSALDELEWQRWLEADPRGYSFVARIVRDVIERDMLTKGQRQRILEAVGGSREGSSNGS